jgi:arylformamidase
LLTASIDACCCKVRFLVADSVTDYTSSIAMNHPLLRDSAYLDTQFNNRLRVPEFAQHFQRWQAGSADARKDCCVLDVPYGLLQTETLDIFPSSRGRRKAPVIVFIHGGYWRSLDKADHSFIAPAFTQDACVVIPNYPLCPNVTMEQLVLTQVQALAWVYRNIAQHGGDASRITVIGHSAGGHLAALLLCCQWQRVASDLPKHLLRNALSLSGLHDLEPLMHSAYIQGDLRLTSAQVSRCSPAYFPAPAGDLIALCGANESDEFIRQNALIQTAWGKRCVTHCETLPSLNHFSVLEALATKGQRAHSLALSLLQ